MIVPVRCFSCGKLIGDKYEEFSSRLKKGEDPKLVLDSLGLKRYCCRRMIISTLDVIDQLIPYSEAQWKRHLNLDPERSRWY